MKNNISKKEYIFLEESNHIEGEYRKEALEDAIAAWIFLRNENEINTYNLLEVHRLLAQRIYPEIAGKFRKCRVWVGGREGSEWKDVPGLIDELFQRKQPKTWKDIKRFHVDYEHIHPFLDLNGRSGRLLILKQCDMINLPMKIIHEKDRYDYYKWFQK